MSNRTKVKILVVAIAIFVALIMAVPTAQECDVVGYTQHGHSVCEEDLND